MTGDLSRRERKLLKHSLTRGRGEVQSMDSSSITADARDDDTCNDEHDLTLWSPVDSRQSNEDSLLLRPIPTALLSLPLILLQACRGTTTCSAPYLKEEVFLNRRMKKSDELLDLMCALSSDEARVKLFCRGLDRFTEPALENDFDARLFLEYIPMLRNMAVYERAANSVPDDTEDLGLGRRRTRKSARRGRVPYFESLNPSYCWDEEYTYSAAAVGERLAESRLHYRR